MDKDNDCKMKLSDIDFDNYGKYIVIDIKCSTIQLNVDGLTCRNQELVKTYKSQLSVYGMILDNNTYNKNKTKNADKGYNRCLTYILPYVLKMEYSMNREKKEINIKNPHNSKYCLVHVDIYDKDKQFYNNLDNYYKKYAECIKKKYVRFLPNTQIKILKNLFKNKSFDSYKDYILNDKLLDINLNEKLPMVPIVKGSFIDNIEIKKWITKQTRCLSQVRGLNNSDLINLNNVLSIILVSGINCLSVKFNNNKLFIIFSYLSSATCGGAAAAIYYI
jgi:hypothetical protein